MCVVNAQVRSVEASLRLDAVASAGLRISRAKATELAKSGDLRCGLPDDSKLRLTEAGANALRAQGRQPKRSCKESVLWRE